MPWLEPVSTIVTAASLASEISRSSTVIKRHALRLVNWVRRGSLVIPIFGVGGVGKSTAGRILTGHDPLDISSVYEESMTKEVISLDGDIPGYIVVGPGQDNSEFSRVNRTWPEMYRAIIRSKNVVILNIVSYGYHSLGIETYKQHKLYEDGLSIEDFTRKYTEVRRLEELRLAAKLVSGISAATGPLAILTIVNKQDLWWDIRNDVRRYYEDGEYREIIEKVGRSIGGQNFQHEIVPASFTLGNLMTTSGELLAPTVSGYDIQTHLAYLQSLFSILDNFIERGR